jgi:hypothetical protein
VDDDRVVEDLVVVMMECLKARVGGRSLGVRC